MQKQFPSPTSKTASRTPARQLGRSQPRAQLGPPPPPRTAPAVRPPISSTLPLSRRLTPPRILRTRAATCPSRRQRRRPRSWPPKSGWWDTTPCRRRLHHRHRPRRRRFILKRALTKFAARRSMPAAAAASSAAFRARVLPRSSSRAPTRALIRVAFPTSPTWSCRRWRRSSAPTSSFTRRRAPRRPRTICSPPHRWTRSSSSTRTTGSRSSWAMLSSIKLRLGVFLHLLRANIVPGTALLKFICYFWLWVGHRSGNFGEPDMQSCLGE